MAMPKIMREEWSNELAEQTLKDFAEMQEEILSVIAERIEKIGALSPEEAAELATSAAAAKYLNEDMARIRVAIKKQDRKFAPRITQIFREVKKENDNYAKKYFEYRKIPLETVKKRAKSAQLINAVRKQTVDGLLNLSHTYAYAYRGKVEPVGQTYRKIVNRAVMDMASGGKTFQKSMRTAVNQLTDSGIKILEWKHEEGKIVVRRADSHIRMNIKEGVKRLNSELREENGKLFGADGVETSMKALCAPDHQPYQGRQFPKKEWEQINKNLTRPWGTLNCGHDFFPIIMGVSIPVHSEAEIQSANDRSNQKVKYGDKEMTRYEASQEMRAMERDIRKYRSRKAAFEKTGDAEAAQDANKEVRARLADYKKFCEAVKLTPNLDRTRIYI